MYYKSKKLMILGGSSFILPLISCAHKLGIYVITCDYLPNNIAHRYSDEYCNVSIVEKETVLDAASKLKVDGICSFACDPGVITAAYVAEKLKLPSVGSYNSVKILQDKGLFRKFLKDNNFNVPAAKSYNKNNISSEDLCDFKFPLFIKPVDSAGSKGVTKIYDLISLDNAIKNALKFSINGKFIVEESIEKRGCSSDTDSFVVNGKLAFSSFNNQYFDKESTNQFVPSAYTFPSDYSSEEIIYLETEIQRLLTLLNMKTGIYNIETRISVDGKPYIMEMSPRGGGNRLAECLDYATNNSLIENVVRSSVGMNLISLNPYKLDKYWAEIILHSNFNAIYKEIFISDNIVDYVFEKDIWVRPGDKVSQFNGANNAIGTIIFCFDSKVQLDNFISNRDEFIKVIYQ